jgi:hypothetical protein
MVRRNNVKHLSPPTRNSDAEGLLLTPEDSFWKQAIIHTTRSPAVQAVARALSTQHYQRHHVRVGLVGL